MSSQIIEHKAGDYFEAQASYSDRSGKPQSLDGIEIRSQIRTQGGRLVSELVIAKADQEKLPGQYLLTAADTNGWPAPGMLHWDIQYTIDDRPVSTQTILIQVIPGITA